MTETLSELDQLVASMLPSQREMYDKAVAAFERGERVIFHTGRQYGRTAVMKALKLRAQEQETQ